MPVLSFSQGWAVREHETAHEDDGGAVISCAGYPKPCRLSGAAVAMLTANGDCNADIGHRNRTAGSMILIANVWHTNP